MAYIHIEESFKKQKEERLPRFIEWIKNKEFIQKEVRKEGSKLSMTNALYYIYVKDFHQAKLSSFNSALNQYYLWHCFNNDYILVGQNYTQYLSLALLSDNELLIKKLGNAGKEIHLSTRKANLNLLLQCAMRDDIDELINAISTYEKYAVKKRWNELHIEFYNAYLRQDEEKVKEVLIEFETPKIKKQSIFHSDFIDKYLSVLTSAYLKLCWRRGCKIEINSPTVPMNMMPVKPLDLYRIDYFYLEGWEDDTFTQDKQEETLVIYQEVGPYPSDNPKLRSDFVNQTIVARTVNHFCTRYTNEEKSHLTNLIWDAYTDPKNFDLNNKDYLNNNNIHFSVTNEQGIQVLESRPFWSEFTEYNDEDFFTYCISFMLMNEIDKDPDEITSYLNKLKSEMEDKGGFLKRLFS